MRNNFLTMMSNLSHVEDQLKVYRFIPENGLIGNCETLRFEDQEDQEEERRVLLHIEPLKPIEKT